MFEIYQYQTSKGSLSSFKLVLVISTFQPNSIDSTLFYRKKAKITSHTQQRKWPIYVRGEKVYTLEVVAHWI